MFFYNMLPPTLIFEEIFQLKYSSKMRNISNGSWSWFSCTILLYSCILHVFHTWASHHFHSPSPYWNWSVLRKKNYLCFIEVSARDWWHQVLLYCARRHTVTTKTLSFIYHTYSNCFYLWVSLWKNQPEEKNNCDILGIHSPNISHFVPVWPCFEGGMTLI